MLRYILSGQPFRHVSTKGLHYLLLGNGISLLSGVVSLARLGWPPDWLSGIVWGMSWLAVSLLATAVWSEARAFAGRPDKPRRFWHLPPLEL